MECDTSIVVPNVEKPVFLKVIMKSLLKNNRQTSVLSTLYAHAERNVYLIRMKWLCPLQLGMYTLMVSSLAELLFYPSLID